MECAQAEVSSWRSSTHEVHHLVEEYSHCLITLVNEELQGIRVFQRREDGTGEWKNAGDDCGELGAVAESVNTEN